METVVALLMFVNFEIKEHRIQDSMGMCLRGKREAERQYSATVSYKCVKTKAEVEINKDGSKSIKKSYLITNRLIVSFMIDELLKCKHSSYICKSS